MRYRQGAFLSLAGVVMLCAGCVAPWDHVTVVCTLPETPPLWASAWGDPSYLLSWSTPFESSGPIDMIRAVGAEAGDAEPDNAGSGSVASGRSGIRVALDVPFAPPVSILATPVWPDRGPHLTGTETLAPCGAVWPLHATCDRLDLDYRRAVVALLLREAARAGVRTDTLNIGRLDAEVDSVCGADPWALDRAQVVRALVADRMRVTAIRLMDRDKTGLTAPDGVWYGFSPFDVPLTGGDPIAVATGTTVWYGAGGGRLLVTSPPDGHAWLALFE